MNYFAHGIRFVDRPYFLAGTALPDWLAVIDRRVRLRSRHVQPFAEKARGPEADLAAGVLQHLADDGWFHKTPAFAVASAELTVLFRGALIADEGHRPAFLGHILTEMLLDSVLIDRQPDLLPRYYDAFSQLDAGIIESAVNQMARQPTYRLRAFIPLFVQEQFLSDYSHPQRLLFRLNQVMRRVRLNPLPANFEAALVEARQIVERHAAGLLSGWENSQY
jgi:hypothetical protein